MENCLRCSLDELVKLLEMLEKKFFNTIIMMKKLYT